MNRFKREKSIFAQSHTSLSTNSINLDIEEESSNDKNIEISYAQSLPDI